MWENTASDQQQLARHSLLVSRVILPFIVKNIHGFNNAVHGELPAVVVDEAPKKDAAATHTHASAAAMTEAIKGRCCWLTHTSLPFSTALQTRQKLTTTNSTCWLEAILQYRATSNWSFAMAGDSVPSLQSLERPEKFQEVLRQDRMEDCLSCKVVGKFHQLLGVTQIFTNKVTGTSALLGLAGYSYMSGMSQLEKQRNAILQSKSMFGMRSRKLGIVSISLGLAWMGMWRAFN